MPAFRQDLRFAIRSFGKSPGYAAVAILTLALGLGASTAIFTVVDAVLLRPMPFAEPDRLVFLRESKLPQLPEFSVSPGNFLAWQAQNGTFEAMAAYGGESFNLTGTGEPERLAGDRATANLFDLLAIRPVVGRTFRPDEDTAGGPPVVLLSYGLWQRRFGGDPGVVGRAISLNDVPCTVVGVLPAAMQALRATTAVWVPMALTAQERERYGSHYLRAVGRLKPGVTLEQARADLDTIARRLEAEHPDDDTGWRVLASSLPEYAVRDVRPALLILLGAVGLVLLVACANVANLQLARGMGRQKELAIRAALGAGRAHLVRQLLAESLLLALAGGAVGLLLAHWLLGALLSLAPAVRPRTGTIALDLGALGFALALSALAPVLFGLLPSLQVTRTDLRDTLNAGGRGAQPGLRRGTRRALIVTEIALAAILLAGAGLLARSFQHLQQVDPGFVASHAVAASLALPDRKYPERPDAFRFYQRLVERVAQIPGVRAAGATESLPLANDYVGGVTIDGRPPVAPTERQPTNYYSVSPGYFAAMGIRLLRGRLFTEQDGPGAPRVGIINETFAKRFFSGEDPLGKRVQVSMGPEAWREVVGIVADTKQYGLTQDASNQFYEPYGQLTFSSMTLVVRTDGDSASVVPSVRDAVHALDPDLPIGGVRTLDDLVAESIGSQRFSTLLLGAFAAAALLLAVIGLYGVLAYAVGQRTLEIGVRMAHGARSGNVLAMFLREGFGLALVGTGLGLAGALLVTRLMASLLFGVEARDPATLALASITIVVVSTLASLVPAWRATRVDPVVALRGE